MRGLSVASFIGRLIALRFRRLGEARKQELLIPSATGQRQIVLLREVDGRSDLNGQVWTREGLIKFIPAQHATATPGALVQYPFG